MENANTFDKNNPSTIQVDPWLNKYSNVVLCPDKVEKARQSLEKFGFPDLEKIRR